MVIQKYKLTSDSENLISLHFILCRRDFVHFAKICFESFGDRVKYWITINEPNLVAEMAFVRGTYPPAHCSPPFGNCSVGNSDVEPLIAMHNALLSHAKAVDLYRKHFQVMRNGSYLNALFISFARGRMKGEDGCLIVKIVANSG